MSGNLSRKILVVVWVAAVWISLLAPRCRAASAEKPASRPTATTAPTTEQAQAKKVPWVRSDSTNGDKLPTLGDRSTGAMWKMLSYMLVIVVLGVLALIVIKRVLPRIGVRLPSGKRISTLETAHLAPRKTVYLLQVGAQKILVGSSREGLSMLADVTKAFDEPPGDSHQ